MVTRKKVKEQTKLKIDPAKSYLIENISARSFRFVSGRLVIRFIPEESITVRLGEITDKRVKADYIRLLEEIPVTHHEYFSIYELESETK